MGEHPNVAAVRDLLAGLNDMDVSRIKARLAPDVTWHMIGVETVEGVEALESLMGSAGDDIKKQNEVHDVVRNHDQVVALVSATPNDGGQTFDYRTAEIYHVADGRVTERWAFSDDTEAINTFFGQFE